MINWVGSALILAIIVPLLYLFIFGPMLVITCVGYTSMFNKNDATKYCIALSDRFIH
jgi:hypothetical protein